jgi:hypothetical protein
MIGFAADDFFDQRSLVDGAAVELTIAAAAVRLGLAPANPSLVEFVGLIDVLGAVDDLDTVCRVAVDTAIVIALRKGEAFIGENSAEQPVDATQHVASLCGRQHSTKRANDAPAGFFVGV